MSSEGTSQRQLIPKEVLLSFKLLISWIIHRSNNENEIFYNKKNSFIEGGPGRIGSRGATCCSSTPAG
jgi:hypothetical protein